MVSNCLKSDMFCPLRSGPSFQRHVHHIFAHTTNIGQKQNNSQNTTEQRRFILCQQHSKGTACLIFHFKFSLSFFKSCYLIVFLRIAFLFRLSNFCIKHIIFQSEAKARFLISMKSFYLIFKRLIH